MPNSEPISRRVIGACVEEAPYGIVRGFVTDRKDEKGRREVYRIDIGTNYGKGVSFVGIGYEYGGRGIMHYPVELNTLPEDLGAIVPLKVIESFG